MALGADPGSSWDRDPIGLFSVHLLFIVACLTTAGGVDTATARLRNAILAAEDRRPTGSAGLRPILEGLQAQDSLTRRIAVRAAGRLEREALLEAITPLLEDPEPAVRAEAVNAVGQSVPGGGGGGAARAYRVLSDRLSGERDAVVRGVIYRTLGRIPLADSISIAAVEQLLIQGSYGPGGETPAALVEGVTHGLASLYRRTATRRPPSPDAIERLVELLDQTFPNVVRRHAIAALVATGNADSGALLDALDDPDPEVRRLAVLPARTQENLLGRGRVLRRAWSDPNPAVRYEALQAYARRQLARDGCEPVVRALQDSSPHVSLLAIDVLADCGPVAALTLRAMARAPFDNRTWHGPAHALVALAQIARPMADSILPAFMTHAVWWARMYAARAAHATGNVPVLERLARDSIPNVQQAALIGLHGFRGHAADPVFVKALASGDYQVLITAAQALDSTSGPATAVPALLRTLQRVTAEQRETSRDARAAILTTLDHIAGPGQAAALRPYLTDPDPAIAAQAADILTRWSGVEHHAEPRLGRPTLTPTWEELIALEARRPVIVMENGGRIALRLLPFEAPANTTRFVRMAREGWFEGLTFHRVVPNFVVQGGSPGANEYMGDGPFTRDELGLRSHHRGTVGVSTRGRDTGDGQIFINLVDNLRLDHNYTIFAVVEEGIEVVDGMLEGAVIARVELGGRRP